MNTYWVCEAHDDRLIGWCARMRLRRGGDAVPDFNPSDRDHPPRPRTGFVPDEEGPDD